MRRDRQYGRHAGESVIRIQANQPNRFHGQNEYHRQHYSILSDVLALIVSLEFS